MKRFVPGMLWAALGLLLAVYAPVRYQVGIGGGDPTWFPGAAAFFPETWLQEGHRRLYRLGDPVEAARAYRKVLGRRVTSVPAWISLAWAESMQGRTGEARRILDLLTEKLARVSSWKWDEFQLAYALEDDEALSAALNFILERIPARRLEACGLAHEYWGEWEAVTDRVLPENHPRLLEVLVRMDALDAALEVWDLARRDGRTVDDALTWRLVNALMHAGRMSEAGALWKRAVGASDALVHNGGFEEPPVGTAFGWRLSEPEGASVERTDAESFEGRFSLHVHFSGTANVNFRHVRQIVPLESDRSYRLRFARKARDLTTDQGLFVEVAGYGCPGLRAASEPVSGTRPWEWQAVDFRVPAECRAVEIRLRRRESLKFDSKIRGDYWLDSVRLAPS